jgi:hypothetical protein
LRTVPLSGTEVAAQRPFERKRRLDMVRRTSSECVRRAATQHNVPLTIGIDHVRLLPQALQKD